METVVKYCLSKLNVNESEHDYIQIWNAETGCQELGLLSVLYRVDCKCNFKIMAKMTMRDLERYPETLCLNKNELDIQVYNLKKLDILYCSFSKQVTCKCLLQKSKKELSEVTILKLEKRKYLLYRCKSCIVIFKWRVTWKLHLQSL